MILTFGDASAVNIQWYNGSDPIVGATDVNYYVTQSGSYTVCGAPGVCPNYIQCLGLTIDVTVSFPLPVISQINDTLFSTAADSYQWFLNGAIIPGATGSFIIPSSSGAYSVSITDDYGCTGLSDPFDFIATGVPGYPSSDLQIFPNPVKDFLQLQVDFPFTGQIAIYDLSGKIMLSENFENQKDLILDVSDYTPGVYFLRMNGEKAIINTHWVKADK